MISCEKSLKVCDAEAGPTNEKICKIEKETAAELLISGLVTSCDEL